MTKSETGGGSIRRPSAGGPPKLLVISLVASGALSIGVLSLLWQQVGRFENFSRIAGRQLEISRRLLSLVDGTQHPTEVERRSIASFVSEFDAAMELLERKTAAMRHVPSRSPGFPERVSAVRRLWDQVESPLMAAARSVTGHSSVTQRLPYRLNRLVEAGSQLVADIETQRQSLQRWLVGALAAVSVFCLMLFYSGLALSRRGAARISNRLSSLVEQTCRRTETLDRRFPAGILALSGDLTVVDVNEAFMQMCGAGSREQVVGRPLAAILPSPTLAKWATQTLGLGVSRESIGIELKGARGGKHLRVVIAPVRPDDDPVARLLLFVEDETELSRLRSTSQEFEQRYRKLLHNVTETVVLLDHEGRIVDLNAAAERLFGLTADKAVGKPLARLMPENSSVAPEHRLVSLLSSGKWKVHDTAIECQFFGKSGAPFPAVVRISSFRAGSRDYYLLNIRDISDSRQAELFARDRLEVIELIARNQPLEKVFTSLAQMLERQIPGSMCFVMLRRADRLYAAAAPSLPDSYVRAVNGFPIGPSVASCGTAAFRGEMVAVADIASDPLWKDYRDLALRHNLRSAWSMPVYSSEGLIAGTIALYHGEPRRPERAQIELLQMASRLAAVSIEQRELTGRLAYQAQHDALTGLPNRLCFEERMKQAIVGARRRKSSLGLLSVDMDRFKLVNDTFGHGVGDGLLQEVARRLRRSVRETDIVARWGGDEFMIGLTEIAHSRDIALVAQKMIDAFQQPVFCEGHELFITATIGASVYPDDGQDLAELVRNADRAMYRAKRQGRNSFDCYSPQDGEVAGERLELQCDLRRALERGQLVLEYQPQFQVSDGELAGLEALLRWNHPRLGVVPPARFIPIAEETGLIVPIGAWVLEELCRQAADWQKAGCQPVRIAMNVSTLQFGRPDFVEAVAGTLARIGVDPGVLELEMTESLVMQDLEKSTRRMHKLRELGVRIAVDDFGTGYSSLSYLQRLPIDTLKIDQSFVQDLSSTSNTLPLVQSIVLLARSLGMSATAEGVETQAQFDALRETGCDLVQGFFLAPPLPGDRVLPSVFNRSQRATPVVTMPPPKEGGVRRRWTSPARSRPHGGTQLPARQLAALPE